MESDSKKRNTFKYFVLIFLVMSLIHFALAFLVKQALKIAIFSETIGIALSLAVVSAIMLIIYFKGRKYIIDKQLISAKVYCFITAHLPVIVWLGIFIFRIVSAFQNCEIDEINFENIFIFLKSFLKVVNSAISLISSVLVLISATICEIFSKISNLKRKEG